MRYHLESTLPIHAFQPLGGRHSPFKHGMTLEGGGGGIIESIGDAFSGVAEGIGDALAGVDSFVGDTIPGGWGTIAAIAVPYAAPMITGAALTAGQAAALAAGTRAATGAIRGEDPEDILKGAALAGATSYGLGSLGGESIDLPSETPYVDMSDTGTLLTPESVPLETAVQSSPDSAYIPDTAPDFDADVTASAQPSVDVTPPDLSVFNPYIDSPDGLTQLGYSPDELAAITSSSTPPALSPEEKFELMMRNAQEAPMSSNFSPAVDANSNFIVDRSQPIPNPEMLEKGYLDRMAELPGAAYDMAKSYVVNNPYTSAALGLGALSLANSGQEPQPAGSPVAADSRYTGGYGSSGGVASPYLLRNRVTASNVYDYENPFDRYATVNRRYAKGGEVKHFAFGGISNALTKTFQPVEKAIVRPIGQAVPFLKDVAPYAGILAAPFIGSPIAAAGIGGLSSGFGRPGSGFDMKRALMGGIAAYGASTLGAGLEAAGGADPSAVASGVPNFDADITATVRNPSLNEAVSKPFFRDVGAMERGVGNLLSPSTYDAAATKFGTQAGIYKTGVPLVIGTSGMMAVDEAQKMKEEADRSAGAGRQEQADMLARISKGRKRAEEAVMANPYMYAMGGSVDDELGGDYSAMGMDQGNMQKGLFGLGYAAGGTPRFLSGGGDGMSDSIPATIGGTQEARLADGEFVIPADVVSHLGNGSSKAGAKQLYSMMDRVRKARTGNEKQGRQIKPNKLMPA